MESPIESLNAYLATQKNLLDKDYNLHENKEVPVDFNSKNIIIGNFYQQILEVIFFRDFGVYSKDIHVIGNGSQGFVIKFNCTDINNGIIKLKTYTKRHYESDRQLPNRIAVKVQLIDTDTSYYENRILREEFLMNYLNILPINTKTTQINTAKKTVQDAIPQFYFGCPSQG